MDLLQIYTTVNSILDTIDFNSLFMGFHKYRFLDWWLLYINTIYISFHSLLALMVSKEAFDIILIFVPIY